MITGSTKLKFVKFFVHGNVPRLFIFIYLGTDFVTDGSLHSAVSESLAQNSKDCVVNMS